MAIYTQTKKANDVIEKEIQVVIKIIRKYVKKGLLSIVLEGGFGRGEGSTIKQDNKYKALNDYDLLLVTEEGFTVNSVTITKIVEELSREVTVRWIDLEQLQMKQLKNLSNSQRNFDLKYGSTIIWGDKKVMKYIPDFKKVSLISIDRVLGTRSWCLLGPFEDKKKSYSNLFKLYQISKAIIALVDAVLILNQRYTSSYEKKLEVLKGLEDELVKEEFIKLATWAINFKLKPSTTWNCTTKIYNDALKLYVKSYWEIMKKRYLFFNEDFYPLLFFIHNVGYVIYSKLKKTDFIRNFIINTAEFYLLNYKYTKKEKYLKKAINLISRFQKDFYVKNQDYSEITYKVLRLHEKYIK